MLVEEKPNPWAAAAALSREAHEVEARLRLCSCCSSAGAVALFLGHLLSLYLPYFQCSLCCLPRIKV